MLNPPDHKVKLGKYAMQQLKDVPPRYLIYMFDRGWLIEKEVLNYVRDNYEEIKKSVG